MFDESKRAKSAGLMCSLREQEGEARVVPHDLP
jgi:hypothetical protein